MIHSELYSWYACEREKFGHWATCREIECRLYMEVLGKTAEVPAFMKYINALKPNGHYGYHEV